MIRTASRLAQIQPFYVMELAKAAAVIAHSPACDPAQGGEPMIYLNIGEPDFGAAPAVRAAAERCLAQGHTAYTQATGLPALRERIAAWYGSHFGLAMDPARIVVTAGASGALQLACLALFEPGDDAQLAALLAQARDDPDMLPRLDAQLAPRASLFAPEAERAALHQLVGSLMARRSSGQLP